MRRMSFKLTVEQITDRTKLVTRRFGWANVRVGERLLAVDRLRSKNAQLLAVIEVVSVREEPLSAITAADVELEGFPGWTSGDFVAMFTMFNDCGPDAPVRRIEFRYVDDPGAAVGRNGALYHCSVHATPDDPAPAAHACRACIAAQRLNRA